ncbi:MAG TPA: hypothetical protein VNA17_05135, partial [Pyrinomonadaceae bacterium]|nr:hypothetical protein [Pyrinomonadaceae bacterium]
MIKSRPLAIAAVLLAAITALSFGLVVSDSVVNRVSAQANTQRSAPTNRNTPTGSPLLDVADQPPNSDVPTTVDTFEIVKRLLLAVLLSGILAFRPRKNVPLFRRSLFVSQSQILLAVVAAALMMIVGDNAARAFAIFAAASLVRFRTNIRDPKEITVLLISLALGLAAGFGRWDLGVA